jgi:hypothetical protein
MKSTIRTFADVLAVVGKRPPTSADQHATRHYSETLSKELAHWVRDAVVARNLGSKVLTPEAKVPTVYGGKSLDVGVLDQRGYLVLDVSIKTFNFKDRHTQNYAHNFSGRFYELLGEELDLRRSYRWATLVALIFLPEDSTIDGKETSSFANAVKWYSKIALPEESDAAGARFEHVYIGLHKPDGAIYFFDATRAPPQRGAPEKKHRLPFDQILSVISETVAKRNSQVATDKLPNHTRFRFAKPTV